MAIRMNFNPAAVLANAQLARSDRSLTSVIERISSGLRVIRASDDPAGMTIANIIRNDIAGYEAATRNSEDGISLLQTAEGAMDSVSTLLLRARELTINAANTGASDLPQLRALQTELAEVVAGIDRVATNTRFGDVNLLDGSMSGNTLAPDATRFLESIDHDDTRLPGGIQAGSTLSLSPPSADLTRENVAVTFQNGGAPAAETDLLSGLTQNGTALSIAGGETLELTGPLGTQTITLNPNLKVGDLAAIINARSNHTGARANYDATTGSFTVESTGFGSGALALRSSDDLSGGGNVGLLDGDTTTTLANPLEAARDVFTMTMQNGGAPAAATDAEAGLTGN
jgi:flagellin-like hook-associated protein FlgL